MKPKYHRALRTCACILACAALLAPRVALAAGERAYPIQRGEKYDFYTRDGTRITNENYTNAYAVFKRTVEGVPESIRERNALDEKERMEKAGYIVSTVKYDANRKDDFYEGYYVESRYTDKSGTPVTDGFEYFLDFPFGMVGVKADPGSDTSSCTLFSYEGTPLLTNMDMICATALPGVCVATSSAGVEIYKYWPNVELVARIQGALDTSTNDMCSAFWVANEDGKLALYAVETGKQLTEYAYQEAYSAQGLHMAMKGTKAGALNDRGEEIMKFEYETVYPSYGRANPLLYARNGEETGLYDVSAGDWIYPMGMAEVTQVGPFYLGQDSSSKKWSVRGESGPLLDGRTFDAYGAISRADDAGKYYADAYLGLWDGDSFLAIDEKGATVDVPAYTNFALPSAYIVGKPDGKSPGIYGVFGLMGKDGEWILPQEYTSMYYVAADVDPGYLSGYSEKLGYFMCDTQGKPYRKAPSIAMPAYDLMTLQRGFYTGLCDADGNWVVKMTNYEGLRD